jgi:DnaK suppressor protein
MPAKKPAAKPAKTRKPVAKKPAASKTAASKKKPVPVKAKAPVRPAPVAVKPLAAKPVAPKPVAAKPVALKPTRPAVAAVPPPRPPAPAPAYIPPRPRPTVSPIFARVAPRPDAEEEGGDASQSLLSGPRNVQPYRAKKGEQYMNAGQVDHFRNILLAWKRDLMEEVDRTVTHMKDEAANPPDPNDRATLESEFSLELRTRDRERKLIRKIDEALKRIEDGTYGYCLETGEEIGIKRLEARPVATLSLEAQERRERREKQYGDRDDRYR